MKTHWQLFICTGLIGLAVFANSGLGAAEVKLKASVKGGCTVTEPSGGEIDFGELNPTTDTAANIKTLNMIVLCTAGTTYTINPGDGQNLEGDTKNMINGKGDLLPYDLIHTPPTVGPDAGPISVTLTGTIELVDIKAAKVGEDYTDTVEISFDL